MPQVQPVVGLRNIRHDRVVPIAAKKIFIVEDNLLFRSMLVELLENEADMTVCGQADNVEDALTLIEQTCPDAVIVDLTLNGSNPSFATRRWRQGEITEIQGF